MAMFPDDPLLSKVMPELKSFREDGNTVVEWEADAWIGRDLQKFWLKSDGELVDSEVEKANIELLYSQAVSAYWDRQIGIRHDIEQESAATKRSWLSIGYYGTAPWFVEVDARLFIGEESSSQLLIELERELMLTQEWIITPELDLVFNGSTNPDYDEGSGLSEVEFSLSIGYERDGYRKIQPFVGLSGHQTFGGTRRFHKARGESSGDVVGLLGLRGWF